MPEKTFYDVQVLLYYFTFNRQIITITCSGYKTLLMK